MATETTEVGVMSQGILRTAPVPFPPLSPNHPKLGETVQPGPQKERSPSGVLISDFWPLD